MLKQTFSQTHTTFPYPASVEYQPTFLEVIQGFHMKGFNLKRAHIGLLYVREILSVIYN